MAEGGGEAAGFIVAPAAVVASESSSDAIVVGPGPPPVVENDDVQDFTDHVLSGAEGSNSHCSSVPMVSGAEVKALAKSEAMDSPDFTVARLLNKLDQSLDHNCDGQFKQLVLAVILMGLPIGLVENAKSIGEIRTAMNKCKVFNGKPLTWLQALLEIVDAKAEFVTKLDSPKKDLDECRKKLGFANVVVRICQCLDTSQFAALKELAQPFLEPKNPVNIQSKVELFRFLSEREQLMESNVDRLAGLMKEIGREDLIANLIEPFKRTENPVTEESGEPAIVADPEVMAVKSARLRPLSASRPHHPHHPHHPPQPPPPRPTISDTGPNVQLVEVEIHQESEQRDGAASAEEQGSRIVPQAGVPSQESAAPVVMRGGNGGGGNRDTQGKFLTDETVAKRFQPSSSPGGLSTSSLEEVEADAVEPRKDNDRKSFEDDLRKPDKNTPQPMTAIAATPPPPKQQLEPATEITPLLVEHKGVSINSESYEAEERRLKKWKQVRCLSQCVCSVSIAAFIALAVSFAVCMVLIHRSTHQLDLLGLNNDTIVIEGSPFCSLSNPIDIHECLYSGDSYHGFDLFLLSENNFSGYRRFRNDTFTSRTFNQSDPSRQTGREDFHYLVQGSFINYTLHYTVDRMPDPGEMYALYLFNDKIKFWNFLSGLDDGGWIVKENLPFDSQDNSVQLNYCVDHSSYYFIAAKTPGGFHYHYSFNFRVAYFNRNTLIQNNFQIPCSVSSTHTCTVNIPAHSSQYILAYIHYSAHSEPLTTHVCYEALDQVKIRTYVRSFIPALSCSAIVVFASCFALYFVYGMVRKSMRALGDSAADCCDVCGCSFEFSKPLSAKKRNNCYERF